MNTDTGLRQCPECNGIGNIHAVVVRHMAWCKTNLSNEAKRLEFIVEERKAFPVGEAEQELRRIFGRFLGSIECDLTDVDYRCNYRNEKKCRHLDCTRARGFNAAMREARRVVQEHKERLVEEA